MAISTPVFIAGTNYSDGYTGSRQKQGPAVQIGAGTESGPFVNSPTIGSVIFVCVADNGAGSGVGTVTDDASPPNVYVEQTNGQASWSFSGFDSGFEQFFTAVCKAVPTHITYQTAGSDPASSSVSAGVIAFYVTGVSPNHDTTSMNGGADNGVGSLSTIYAPALDGELALAITYVGQANGWSGWNHDGSTSSNWTQIDLEEFNDGNWQVGFSVEYYNGARTAGSHTHFGITGYTGGNQFDAAITVLAFPATVPPTLSKVTPAYGPTAGGTPVTIAGTGFTPGSSVTFDGFAPTSLVIVSATKITCVTPVDSAGPASVQVNADGGSIAANLYTYVAPWSGKKFGHING